MKYWHYSLHNKKEGPVSEEILVHKIQEGLLKSGTLVWKRGMKTWEPLEVHFSEELSKVKGYTDAKATLPKTQNATSEIKQEKKEPFFSDNSSLIKRLFKPLLLTIGSMFLFWWVSESLDTDNIVLIISSWIGSILLMCCSGFFLIYKLWREAVEKEKNTNCQKGGGLKLASVALGICLSMFAIFYIVQTPVFFKIGKVRQAYNDFTIEVDVASDTISIAGTIGSKFSKELADKLNLYAGIKTIIINSPGGLVDEALDAAKEIEKYPEIKVIAKCPSTKFLNRKNHL